MKTNISWLAVIVLWTSIGFYWGYKTPRDLELDSTKPIEISYEITPEAARLLVVRAVSGFPKCEP